MDNSTNDFIANVNKSNQKPIEYIDAFTGKPIKALDVTFDYACRFIAGVAFVVFVIVIVFT